MRPLRVSENMRDFLSGFSAKVGSAESIVGTGGGGGGGSDGSGGKVPLPAELKGGSSWS